MAKNLDYSVTFSSKVEENFKKGEFLAQGHEGIVFKLPNNRILKIFREEKIWKDECYILEKTRKSKYFPKIIEAKKNYIIREFIEGERLDYYIEEHGFDKWIGNELYNMLMSFKKLKFKRIDIRCKDLYIYKGKKIRVIDPKNNYKKRVNYPRHLMKGLYKLGVLDSFLDVVKTRDKDIGLIWEKRFEQYWKYNIK